MPLRSPGTRSHRPRRPDRALRGLASLGALLLGLLLGLAPAAAKPPPDSDGEGKTSAPPAATAALDAALSGLPSQRPGRPDLYLVAMAGDGGEPVFGHEVRYVGQLLDQRFDGGGRNLLLINTRDGRESEAPEASLANLRAGLAHVAGLMDPDEDALLLFLTSHGSATHEFYIRNGGVEGVQIRPEHLRAALDEAGIQRRVVVVSACYSGGFVPALADARTLVITAARHDRPSFGCGVSSRITYFGEAFLAGALNQTADFAEAFRLATHRVTAMEKADRFRPSHPQMAGGEDVLPWLQAWQASFTVGPPLPYTADGKPVGKRR